MVDEANFVEEMFKKNFSKEDKLVIYGLGNNTKTVLERCPEYHILGLMDRLRTGETEWGKRILSIEEVNDLNVKKIIIIATSANVPVIYRRIAKKAYEYGISVYDINGNLQRNTEEAYEIPSFYRSCEFEKLKEIINAYDVVSFDVFDTLITREVLYPADIFEIVEKNIKDSFCLDFRYSETRIQAEMELYKCGNPTIFDIYNKIEELTGVSHAIAMSLMEAELKEEGKHIIARARMVELVEYAHNLGKIVCCTSDMYLPTDIINGLVESCGFKNVFDSIFVSCEYGYSKSNGLFKAVRAKYKDKRIIHIGDNYEADVKAACMYGIDETFLISSPLKMLSDGTMNYLLNYDGDLAGRCEIGRTFAHLFNDPFLFSETEGKCSVEDNYSLGYFFIEPIIASFVEWMLKMCKEEEIDTLLLGSRDGYIIDKILSVRKKYIGVETKYIYFYASRYACTLAGLCSRDDVMYAYRMAFDGTPDELLRKRFSLCDAEIEPYNAEVSEEEYLEKYISVILNKSCKYRENYRSYIKKCMIQGNKVGFFDFVSSGTCQLWLENIYPEFDWTGYYFVRNLDPYKEKLKINSIFKPGYVYEKQSKLFRNYIFMENIMTSFDPTVKGFSNDGEVIFGNDYKSEYDQIKLSQVHKGILDAYERRISNGAMIPIRDLADDLLDLLNPKYSVIKADFFENNTLSDEFCNRSFDLRTVIGT